jgi:hypothetical protein
VNTHVHFCAHLQHTRTYPSSHASNKSSLVAMTLQSCTATVYQNTTTQVHMSLPLHTKHDTASQVITTSHTSIFPVFFRRPLAAEATFRSHITPRGICGGQSNTRTASPSSSIGATTRSWVLACSTVVEHSQQEGFTEGRCQRHVKPSTWRRTRDLERSSFRRKRPPASEATLANPAAEGGTMGEKVQHPLSVSFHWRSIFIHVSSTLLICLTASLNNTQKFSVS